MTPGSRMAVLIFLIFLGDACQTRKNNTSSNTAPESAAQQASTPSAGYLKLAGDAQAASQQLLASGTCTNPTDAMTQAACSSASNYAAANLSDTAQVFQDSTTRDEAQNSVEEEGGSGLVPVQIAGISMMVLGGVLTVSSIGAFVAGIPTYKFREQSMAKDDISALFPNGLPKDYPSLTAKNLMRLRECLVKPIWPSLSDYFQVLA